MVPFDGHDSLVIETKCFNIRMHKIDEEHYKIFEE